MVRAISMFAVLVFVSNVLATDPPVCNTTFTGEGDGETWQVEENWDDGVPNASKVACVPANFAVVIKFVFGPDAHAKALYIERTSPTTSGSVRLRSGTRLTLYENSRIDGSLLLPVDSKLIIANDLTIIGQNGAIKGTGSVPSAVIEGIAGETIPQLTLAGDNNSNPDTSLVAHGSLTIDAKLNNHAYVIADEGELVLAGRDKSGSGYWVSGADSSTFAALVVDATVRGNGHWMMTKFPGAIILVKKACDTLSGPVTITHGTLEAQADFITTGDFEFRSVGTTTPTEPKILVLNATVEFGS